MDCRRTIESLGGYGVPGAGAEFPAGPLGPDDWALLRREIRVQKLPGQAAAAADDGAFPVTDEQRTELEWELTEAMAHCLRLEEHLVRMHQLLGQHGIPFLVLKGSAVAHLDYAEPRLRPFIDNDILIPSGFLEASFNVLLAAGYVRPATPLRAGYDRQFGKGATLRGQDDYELDVHRTLAMGPFGYLVDLAELWDSPSTFSIAGLELQALRTEQRYLHAAYHSVIGNPERKVQPYRDLAEMFLFGEYDADRLRHLAESWHGEIVLAKAITDTWDVLGLGAEADVPLLAWARAQSPTRQQERLLTVYESGTSYAAKCLAALSVMRTWRERGAFVSYLTAPGNTFLGARGESRIGWASRAVGRAVQSRGGLGLQGRLRRN